MHDDSTTATVPPAASATGPARDEWKDREAVLRTELAAVERRGRELRAELAALQAAHAPPMHEDTRRQLDDYLAIEEMARRGELEDYHGEYVFVLYGKVVDHGPDPAAVRTRLAAAGHPVPVSRISFRFIL